MDTSLEAKPLQTDDQGNIVFVITARKETDISVKVVEKPSPIYTGKNPGKKGHKRRRK